MTTTTYRPSTRKYCPTCGGKAQDAQILAGMRNEDGELLEGAEDAPCDEPYHDPADEDYQED